MSAEQNCQVIAPHVRRHWTFTEFSQCLDAYLCPMCVFSQAARSRESLNDSEVYYTQSIPLAKVLEKALIKAVKSEPSRLT